MSAQDERIVSLIEQIVVLEAAVRTGATSASAPSTAAYPFLSRLQGEDLLAAQALVQENAALRERAERLQEALGERDYRIQHLKLSLEKLIVTPTA
jgi:hypothetical protein